MTVIGNYRKAPLVFITGMIRCSKKLMIIANRLVDERSEGRVDFSRFELNI